MNLVEWPLSSYAWRAGFVGEIRNGVHRSAQRKGGIYADEISS
jgi:hypothetical protein